MLTTPLSRHVIGLGPWLGWLRFPRLIKMSIFKELPGTIWQTSRWVNKVAIAKSIFIFSLYLSFKKKTRVGVHEYIMQNEWISAFCYKKPLSRQTYFIDKQDLILITIHNLSLSLFLLQRWTECNDRQIKCIHITRLA